jgi:hypothetical protein
MLEEEDISDETLGNQRSIGADELNPTIVVMEATEAVDTRRRGAQIIIDNTETEVLIGTVKRKVKVRKAKLNTMDIANNKKEGEDKMI